MSSLELPSCLIARRCLASLVFFFFFSPFFRYHHFLGDRFGLRGSERVVSVTSLWNLDNTRLRSFRHLDEPVITKVHCNTQAYGKPQDAVQFVQPVVHVQTMEQARVAALVVSGAATEDQPQFLKELLVNPRFGGCPGRRPSVPPAPPRGSPSPGPEGCVF